MRHVTSTRTLIQTLWLCSRRKATAHFLALLVLAVLLYVLMLLVVELPFAVWAELPWSRASKDVAGSAGTVESYCRESVKKVECPTEENWVYVHNGTFHISAWARWRYGKIDCEYAPIVRGIGDFAARLEEHAEPIFEGLPLTADFFKVACMSPSGKHYHNIHAGVAFNKSLHARALDIPLPSTALGFDVFMFGFDSTSRMAWMRNLPKTREFFLHELGGLELEGYNIVGDGTVQALLPILTGRTEHDLPSARRDDHDAATEVDNFPWIWNLFKEAGYVTAWAEDMSYIGTFQMRLKGFREQPTDHSMRNYFQLAEPMYRSFLPWCAGSEVRHMRFLNWFRDLYDMYGPKSKFMFGFHSEYSHNSINDLKKIDDDLCNLLKDLLHKGHLNRTILILMADHGGRFSDLRGTVQGKLEERMPYFAFLFPPSFKKSHPGHFANLITNTKRLTTPFDIHETLLDVLNFGGRQESTPKRGVSLFKEVPSNRTCAEAGIKPHWCSCLHWTPVRDREKMNAAAEAVVGFINNMTAHVRDLCADLTLGETIDLSQYTPGPEVLRYKQSLDFHGDHPDLSDNMTLDNDNYQVSLVTEPGHGRFEVTVTYFTFTKEFYVSEGDISRTNRYNDASSCLQHKYPHLRPYCYCL